MKRIYYIPFICMALFIAGCTTEPDVMQDVRGNDNSLLRFGANRDRIVTRLGDETERFADGTLYDLYVLDAASSSPWLVGGTNPPILSNDQGIEVYDNDEISYGTEKKSYNRRTLNIYAATLGSITDNPGKSQGEVTYTTTTPDAKPKYGLRTGETLPGIPDLMRAKYAGATGDNGKITLDFKHTLSKLTFEVVKQDETADAPDLQKLNDVYVASIRIKNARTSGQLDLASGAFENLAGGDTPEDQYRDFFTMGSSPWPVPHTTPQLLTVGDGKTGTDTREIYIFPNTVADGKTYIEGERNKPLVVEVVLRKMGDDTYNEKKTIPLYEAAKESLSTTDAFRFKANHEYRLTITVLRDNVQIITISPMVYDWIPGFTEGEKDIDYVGQPVTFGNLMWMDRNLGADSSDPTTAENWYKTLGYYYQHGRNIPYIMDKKRWLASSDIGDNNIKNFDIYKPDSSTRLWVMKIDGVNVPTSGWFYTDRENDPELFYTYDYKGGKVYGAHTFVGAIPAKFIPVRFPGEEPKKWSGSALVSAPENYSSAYRFSIVSWERSTGSVNTWYAPAADVTTFWSDKNDQPCPPGWRLPTKEDFKTFMPPLDYGVTLGWNTESCAWPTISTNKLIRYGYETETVHINGGNYPVHILRSQHIINHGQPNAYRIQIESRLAEGCINKRYMHVARFPVTNPNLMITAYDPVNDWKEENIIEEMYFPASGGLVSDQGNNDWANGYPSPPELRWFGTGTVLRTSETNDKTPVCDVCYMATSDFQLSIARNSRRVLGCQIRCVRDAK